METTGSIPRETLSCNSLAYSITRIRNFSFRSVDLCNVETLFVESLVATWTDLGFLNEVTSPSVIVILHRKKATWAIRFDNISTKLKRSIKFLFLRSFIIARTSRNPDRNSSSLSFDEKSPSKTDKPHLPDKAMQQRGTTMIICSFATSE